MGEVRGFIMSLVSAAAATALIECFVPDGGMKKYVKYLVSLIVLLVLLSPIKKLIGAIPEAIDDISGDYSSVEALSRANSIVAMHIEKSLREKFSLGVNDVDVVYDGAQISVGVRRHIGLFESDFVQYIFDNYGVEAEVSFFE